MISPNLDIYSVCMPTFSRVQGGVPPITLKKVPILEREFCKAVFKRVKVKGNSINKTLMADGM